MGKISYRPRKNQGKQENKKKIGVNKTVDLLEEREELIKYNTSSLAQEESNEPNKIIAISSNKKNHEKLDNLKIVGEMDCKYHIFVEDYVYTYIYQLAKADLSKESSAVLIGEIFEESKEAIIRGIIPINMEQLSEDSEWIDGNILDDVEEQRKIYFNNQNIIGWMHMQPGYGTMLTMKELREHKNVFEGSGSICLLVDAINKVETVFVYEDEELKEQSGYCMYYERNEAMQQYMLDHPFSSGAKEEMKDVVVNQFREIGKIRKAEYAQRKSLNFTVMLASIILIALTAVIVKMNDDRRLQDIAAVNSDATVNQMTDEEIDLAIAPAILNEEVNSESTQESIVDEQTKQSQEAFEESKDILPSQDNLKEDSQEYEIYVVEVGDTLADISYKKYGEAKKSVDIAKVNNIENTDQIYVGQELKLPIYNDK